jgi:hypothetical protein
MAEQKSASDGRVRRPIINFTFTNGGGPRRSRIR